MPHHKKPRRLKVGLALGSGSARGWSHIGVIRELLKLGIKPDIVCGTSIGALVGGAYASGNLDMLEEWVRGMDRMDVVRYLDVTRLGSGGAIKGERLFAYLESQVGKPVIEDLEIPFAAVATKLASGQELWFQEGPLLEAIRASISLPGLFTPIQIDDEWIIDGGLVNPVPVSLCRAMGANIVIAVNLNGDLLNRHFTDDEEAEESPELASLPPLERMAEELKLRTNAFLSELFDSEDDTPGIFDVLAASISIMQDRITRSRMAGEFPDVMLAPRLAQIGLMEYHRADEAIEEGRATVRRALPSFHGLLL
ncbi:MAG: patatin-like phospholipase RssA [Acidiferrobacterales bacterium]|jgi:NTE family protein|nr:patatin-like phospholipase RssA [Acidiferrobacterales bacterium]